MDVADSGLALWLGWMERSSHHVPGDLLEFKARRDLQRHDLALGDPYPPGFSAPCRGLASGSPWMNVKRKIYKTIHIHIRVSAMGCFKQD
jgi:hypothetical protein